MMQTSYGARHPKLHLTVPWEAIEREAQNQILRVLSVPELESLAIMPDVHPGYDLCIGGVALLRGLISPSFVGYDIGCGMCHVNVGENADRIGLGRPKDREKFFARLQRAVPSAMGEGKGFVPVVFRSADEENILNDKVNKTAARQLGSLGSGNHFLELGVNSRGDVGITIHSGSRRAGYDIADWYIRKAKGSFIALDCELGQAYVQDMLWATEFALENRRMMLQATLALLGFDDAETAAYLCSMINENHNHAVLQENSRVLHRKGATPAELGQLGVIPANQRDGVWVTRGLGNENFLCSASHGAGRTMTRAAAAQRGSVERMRKMMKGIVCRADKDVLDEAPWAYKKIDAVLAAQTGMLIEVIDHFAPIIVLKGGG
ncbi:MAG: RtcB family protein [Betaproteobacteria bacterium]|nr:RtcB family protein [Betaproteobacteria bacterium]